MSQAAAVKSMSDAMRTGLEGFLAQRLDVPKVTLEDARLLSGGAIQENWLVRVRRAGDEAPLEYVVRTDSASGVAASHGRPEEFALLRAVHEAGVTVPEPLWLCEDTGPTGRQFFVMRRVGGLAAGHRVVRDASLGGDRTALAGRLGAELARIHSVRPPRADLAFLEYDSHPPAQRFIARVRRLLDAYPLAHPVLEWGLRRLERDVPETPTQVLCHRDFRTGNYMVDHQGLTGILDWEFAGWSDPLEDIGWFCAKCWRFGVNGLEAGGIGEREDFYRGYEAAGGLPINRAAVAYWELVAHVNWAVIALQQAQRHCGGGETSLELALTGHIVPELEWEILAMTDPDR